MSSVFTATQPMMKWQGCEAFTFISWWEERTEKETNRAPAAGDIVWERVLMLSEVSLVMYLLRVEYLPLHIFLICLSLQTLFIIGGVWFFLSE